MRLAFVPLALLALAAAAAAQGKLQRSREEPPHSPPSRDSNDAPPGGDEDELLGELLGPIFGPAFGVVLTAPFTVPARLLGDHIEREALFPGHPYARPEGGYLNTGLKAESGQLSSLYDTQTLKPWSVRLAAEYGQDFNGLHRNGYHLFLDTGFRLGLSTRWDHYRELLPSGVRDSTTLGDAHLTVRFAQSRAAAFHAGLGARWRFDRHDTSGGVSFLYGADFFPIHPLVLSASVDLGSLDRQFAIRGRASAGWQFGRCEILGGYDIHRIGRANLQGPFLGLRLWF